jgi:hypothetical protein
MRRMAQRHAAGNLLPMSKKATPALPALNFRLSAVVIQMRIQSKMNRSCLPRRDVSF